jgi:hypothetical protein
VEKRLAELDLRFLNQLDGLLRRKVITEQEFSKAIEKARSEKTELVGRKEELLKAAHINKDGKIGLEFRC